jgi:phage terminase Nu1 subunit (DNA packaging protein)
MAHLQQEASEHPAVLIHQHQIALVAIQDLERQRLALAQRQNPQLENQQDSQKPIQTLYLTEDNNGT